MRQLLPCVAACAVLLSVGSALVAAPVEDRHPLFDRIDRNQDGVLSLQEWLDFRQDYLRQRRQEAAEVGVPRTMAGLNAHARAKTTKPAAPAASTASAASAAPTASASAPLVAVSQKRHPLFDRIDTNQDGMVSLAEWVAFRTAHAGAFAAHRRRP